MRRQRLFLFLAASLLALAVFHRPLLIAYASLFRVDDPTPGSDLILILSGHPQSRAMKAIELYRSGFGGPLMVTRACDLPTSPSAPSGQYGVLRVIAAREAVAIAMLPPVGGAATSTYDEAVQAAHYSRQHGLHHIIVVTDAFHTARARYIFEKIFRRQGIHTRLEFAAATDSYDESNWWHSPSGLYNYLTEPVKFFYYLTR